jgi:hypothetical protein
MPVISITACGLAQSTPEISPIPFASETKTTFAPSPSPSPTPYTPLVIWLSSSSSNPIWVDQIRVAASELSESSGMKFETREAIVQGDIPNNLNIVIALAPNSDISSLADFAPNVQFVAIGIIDLTPSSNLTILAPQGNPLDQVAFLAGYLAALTTPDWRVAIISAPGSNLDDPIIASFYNGLHYYCGLCNPPHPPYGSYPILLNLNPDASEQEIQAIVDQLIQNSIRTVYISPQSENRALIEDLSDNGIHWIAGNPFVSPLEDEGIAIVGTDPSLVLRDIWPDITSNHSMGEIVLAPSILESNSQLLSPGRLQLAENIAVGLKLGIIAPIP